MKSRVGLFLIALAASPLAGAHTVQWYSAHLNIAQATRDACFKQKQAGEQLSAEAMEECQRASTAYVHSATFTPSTAKSY